MTQENDDTKKAEAELKEELEKEFWLEFPLSKPLEVFSEEREVLQLRQPTTPEVIKIGEPMKYFQDGSYEMNGEKAEKWIEKLAGLPHGSAKRLQWEDYMKLKVELTGFFAGSLDD